MKYLYYGTKDNENQVTGTLKKKKSQEIIQELYLNIEEYFKLKESGEYEIIKIQTTGLYYKTSKYSKKRILLSGEINLFEFENGGTWENVSIIKQIKIKDSICTKKSF